MMLNILILLCNDGVNANIIGCHGNIVVPSLQSHWSIIMQCPFLYYQVRQYLVDDEEMEVYENLVRENGCCSQQVMDCVLLEILSKDIRYNVDNYLIIYHIVIIINVTINHNTTLFRISAILLISIIHTLAESVC